MQNRFKVLLGVILLFPMFAFAKINMAEVNAYAYEGLADMCANSRHITGEQQKELQAIYLQTKHARQKSYPPIMILLTTPPNSYGISILRLTMKSVLSSSRNSHNLPNKARTKKPPRKAAESVQAKVLS